MKKIKLTQNKVALIDDADFDYINQFKWHAVKNGQTFYAERSVKIEGKRTHIKMHRDLLQPSPEHLIDHRDRNGLNNQRSNLRTCSIAENNRNKIGVGVSKYKGVALKERRYKTKSGIMQVYRYWHAAIQVDGKPKHLGYFKKEVDAAASYNKAAMQHHGDFKQLNVL